MLKQPRGVCWDLDHTLIGLCRAPTIHAMSDALAPRATEIVVRPGIAHTLERLAHRGYWHVVTTGGTREYAEAVLAATGLRQHFTGIFEGAEIDAGAGKRYRPAARSLGMTDEEARRRLIAVGDLVYDQPADIGGLVFIHQPNGFRSEGGTVEGVIEWLEEAAGGGLLEGFETCLALARPEPPWLPAGVTMRLELRSPHHPRRWPRLEDIMIPTVRLLPDETDGATR